MPEVGNKSRYCAIFADIIKSRRVPERGDLQKQLGGCLNKLNEHFADQFVAPFRFVAGDEVHGVLHSESESYSVIKMLQSGIYPHKMRFAVGIGGINTEYSTDVTQLDGPALHRASSAMLLLKNRKRSHGRTIYYCSENSDNDKVLNALTFLVGSIRLS